MTTLSTRPPSSGSTERLARLASQIEDALHLLPAQGPISVFVHHNTLHAFEEEPFEQAVRHASAIYDSAAFLPESMYRELLDARRIRREDLDAVLREDLGPAGDQALGTLATRLDLRLAMLAHRHHVGTDEELRWAIADTQAMGRFRPSTPEAERRRCIDRTQRWCMRDLPGDPDPAERALARELAELREEYGPFSAAWSDEVWEPVTLRLLWGVCEGTVADAQLPPSPGVGPRHRDALLAAGGADIDLPVNEVLVRFCAAFLDQGLADWPLPGRESGFFESFMALHRGGRLRNGLLSGFQQELLRVERAGLDALGSVDESLNLLGVAEDQRAEVIVQTLLALRGWAGATWQLESNAEWTVRPAPPGSIVGYLAVRLLLERVALRAAASGMFGAEVGLDRLRAVCLERVKDAPALSRMQLAYWVFQLAQVLCWSVPELLACSAAERRALVDEVLAFDRSERQRVFHLAYERRYRHWTLDAVLAQCTLHNEERARLDAPDFQVLTCIDEREESFRRHLEELDPTCETLGVAGFYGVAMYYRGVNEAHFRPLCPVSVKPVHFVEEEAAYSLEQLSRRQTEVRQRIGHSVRRVHVGTRGFLGGVVTALVGSLATIPMVARVLFPRSSARLRSAIGGMVKPAVTQLLLEQDDVGREAGDDTPAAPRRYRLDEMCDVVAGVLRDLGLKTRCAPLVVVVGHGSSSLNNPHEAAHDCGACGGGRGGPNARAFAQMANDPRVRAALTERGFALPEEIVFVGAFHNTCDDSVSYYDLDHMPRSHRDLFERARDTLDRARRRNAHERCRRFESAPLSLSQDEALSHVETRSQDLSQTRPEFGHATNAVCLVGRRDWSRGLFLDRRAFLTSYDPAADDERGSVLEGMLRAVIPVCAGISLEYYFSFVDPARYGCGTKLPHNITGLVGVMEGASGDLRPGLPWQMVEIHEPVRILFVIEADATKMAGILEANPALGQLVRNAWVQLALLDPAGPTAHVYRQGRFEPYEPEVGALPQAPSSEAWYRGQRGHLQFASITPPGLAS